MDPQTTDSIDPLDDQISGGPDSDTLFGNFGSDVISGGPGDDFIDGDNPVAEPPPGFPPFPPGGNNDTCSGGPGTNDVQNCEAAAQLVPIRWWSTAGSVTTGFACATTRGRPVDHAHQY